MFLLLDLKLRRKCPLRRRAQGQNRMTDQAAAEALVAVGRGSQGHGQDRSVGEETTDDESESRSRKKPRRSAPEISGVDMDVDEGKSDRQRRRDNADPQASHGWMDQQQQQGSPSNFAGNFSAVDPQGGQRWKL